MSDTALAIFALALVVVIGFLVTAPVWWGFWRPEAVAARRFERSRTRRIASLIDLGVHPDDAERECDEQILRESRRTLAIVREVQP